MDFLMTTPDNFAEIVAELRATSPLHQENVSPPMPWAGSSVRYYLAEDGSAGFAVAHDGELRHVWSTKRGQGDAIVAAAVDAGADNLDCFEGHLSSLYARHGFRIVKREANWDAGGPDVVYMARCSCAASYLDIPIHGQGCPLR